MIVLVIYLSIPAISEAARYFLELQLSQLWYGRIRNRCHTIKQGRSFVQRRSSILINSILPRAPHKYHRSRSTAAPTRIVIMLPDVQLLPETTRLNYEIAFYMFLGTCSMTVSARSRRPS
ncbi:uncharacterized protein BO66DRAFT_174694 [Aspergillus aculeatinus CBS 121060]|uniref:Uncharacterized protein n=1 Tax=Aspergillus aculeatinus CBS 121060 TaxID=1448322 RepID=A0ACD1HJU2_9EURO|nr:hypothetical protein BO66DRAFT_174694 [Aspergillus aculeatinus CBS 121060]RAH73865.1 hypothetical protein BO66DRAFT_174694 [Aspergillus aculeatinus CBS 121060]